MTLRPRSSPPAGPLERGQDTWTKIPCKAARVSHLHSGQPGPPLRGKKAGGELPGRRTGTPGRLGPSSGLQKDSEGWERPSPMAQRKDRDPETRPNRPPPDPCARHPWRSLSRAGTRTELGEPRVLWGLLGVPPGGEEAGAACFASTTSGFRPHGRRRAGAPHGETAGSGGSQAGA